MITFDNFRNMHESNVAGRARKIQSDVIMKETWWQDIQAQWAYMYDMFHDVGDEHFLLNDLHPQNDPNKVAVPIKFIRHSSQTYNKDPVTYWLQLLPGQECVLDYFDDMYTKKYGNFWPVGCFVDVMDESGKYNKWLCVNTANYNQNQFPTFELLRCDYIVQWIHKGHKYECPGVLQSQNSYNSGLNIQPHILEIVYENFLNCWKTLRALIPKQRDEICSNGNGFKSLRIGQSAAKP